MTAVPACASSPAPSRVVARRPRVGHPDGAHGIDLAVTAEVGLSKSNLRHHHTRRRRILRRGWCNGRAGNTVDTIGRSGWVILARRHDADELINMRWIDDRALGFARVLPGAGTEVRVLKVTGCGAGVQLVDEPVGDRPTTICFNRRTRTGVVEGDQRRDDGRGVAHDGRGLPEPFVAARYQQLDGPSRAEPEERSARRMKVREPHPRTKPTAYQDDGGRDTASRRAALARRLVAVVEGTSARTSPGTAATMIVMAIDFTLFPN